MEERGSVGDTGNASSTGAAGCPHGSASDHASPLHSGSSDHAAMHVDGVQNGSNEIQATRHEADSEPAV
eukprot:4693364-Lingulodinium_polyedra.AAC.1